MAQPPAHLLAHDAAAACSRGGFGCVRYEPDNVALIIFAKSGTALDVRREALSCIPTNVGAGR